MNKNAARARIPAANAATPTPMPALAPMDKLVSPEAELMAVGADVSNGLVIVVSCPSVAVDVTVALPLVFGVWSAWKLIVSPFAVGRDATWAKLLGPVRIPLSGSVQVHAAGGPISVLVAGMGQALQTTELSVSESAHCTRLRSCCSDAPFPGHLGEVKSSSVQPAKLRKLKSDMEPMNACAKWDWRKGARSGSKVLRDNLLGTDI